MSLRMMQFIALVLTALALIPAGAHLFELPNKINLDQDDYFVVQSIYRGWAVLGAVLVLAAIANLVLAILSRGRGPSFWMAVAAFLLMAGSLAIFFIWTYPTNVATDNWTEVPDNWEALRTQWEYSHAANAIVTFVAFCFVVLSVVVERQGERQMAATDAAILGHFSDR